MPSYISHLGHNQALSIAEIHKAFKATDITIHHGGYLSFSSIYNRSEIQAKFPTLGGQRLIAEVYKDHVPSADQNAILLATIKSTIGDNKYQFALSSNRNMELQSIAMNFKKQLVKEDKSIRIINKNNSPISPALAKKERIGTKAFEWHIIDRGNNECIIAETIAFQDIDGYSDRDMGKSRDMNVGMLPPKLSQILLNLAELKAHQAFYDPFCGLGTLPIEALRYEDVLIIASDIEESLVAKTKSNLEQMQDHHNTHPIETFTRNALQPSHDLGEIRKHYPNRSLTVATEWYLGPIIRKYSNYHVIEEALNETTPITHGFIKQLAKDLRKWERACICMPCWFYSEKYTYIPQIVSILSASWFAIERIEHPLLDRSYTARWSLIYRRETQNVGREIFVLIKS